MRPSHIAVAVGVIDVSAIVKAGEGHTEWLIVELDQCATDMLTAVSKSCKYRVGRGLAPGKSRGLTADERTSNRLWGA